MRKIVQNPLSDPASTESSNSEPGTEVCDIDDTARLPILQIQQGGDPELGALAADMGDLQSRWEQMLEALEERDETVDALRAKIASMESQVEELEAEAQVLAGNQASAEADLMEARRQLASADQAREAAESRAREYANLPMGDSGVRQLRNEAANAEKRSVESRDRCADLELRLRQARQGVQTLETYINHRAERWRESRQELQALRDSLYRTRKAQNKSRRARTRLQNRLARSLAKLRRARRQSQGARTQLAAMRSKCRQQDKALHTLEDLGKAVSSSQDEACTSLEAFENRAGEQDRQIMNQAGTLSELDAALNKLAAQLTELRSGAESSGDEADYLRRRWAEDRDQLMRTLHVREKELQVANDSVSELTESLAVRDQELMAMDHRRARLEDRMRTFAGLSEALQQENRRRRELLDANRESRQRQIAQTFNLEQRLKDAEVQLSHTSTRLDAQRQDFDRTREQLASAVEREEAMTGEFARRDRLEQRLRRQLSDARTQRDSLSEELTAQCDRVSRLEAELDSRRRTIAAIRRNVGRLAAMDPSNESHPTQAVPLSASSRMLVSVSGSPVTRFPLFKDRVVLGRDQGADILLDSQFASRTHARILNRGSGAIIEDLGSRNGTLVNNRRIRRTHLQDGDLVAIGELRYRFVDLTSRARGALN